LIGELSHALQDAAGPGFGHASNTKKSESFVQVRNIGLPCTTY
jgi:hypothetical protein